MNKAYLINLLINKDYDNLEKKLKELYPQIDGINWEADKDGDIDLHIVFVKMPYMLPFSGSSYAHFSDLITTENGMGLIDIMKECRIIEKEDVYEQYSSLEAENYAHDLENRGYDVDQFEDLYGDDYVNALWDIIQEIKEKEELA